MTNRPLVRDPEPFAFQPMSGGALPDTVASLQVGNILDHMHLLPSSDKLAYSDAELDLFEVGMLVSPVGYVAKTGLVQRALAPDLPGASARALDTYCTTLHQGFVLR
eukprot:SAG22_NODE_3594_length_1627_cov_1.142670_1_plen_107_part_00